MTFLFYFNMVGGDSVGKGVVGINVCADAVGSRVIVLVIDEPGMNGIGNDVISPNPNFPPCTIKVPFDVTLY